MNRLTDFQKRMIVLGIASLLVLFGVVQGVFKLDFFVKYKSIIDNASFVLMMLAAALLFSIKRKPQSEPEAPSEDKAAEEIEETTGVPTKDPD